MNMKTLHLLALVLLTVCCLGHCPPSHAGGNPITKSSCSPYVEIDTKIDKNFNFLKQKITEGFIYKGLPGAFHDPEGLKKEKAKPHFQKEDDYFYEKPAKINLKFIEHIKNILNTKNAVCGYPDIAEGGLMPVKFCGGFHADYMITLHTETQKIDMQICYGCGDMRLFIDDVFINEYDMNTEYIFKEWTAPYSDLGSPNEKSE